VLALLLTGCGSEATTADEVLAVRTPVTLASMRRTAIAEEVGLNATSVFQRKNSVRANIAGFVERSFIRPGDHVSAGQDLYLLRTKEARALGEITAQDSSFRVKGAITVKAPSSGLVVQVDRSLNDYVNDGDQLAVIADENTFAFIVNVPYELNAAARIGSICTVLLADSSTVEGRIAAQLSAVDPVAQTQGFVVRPIHARNLPEGLIGRVLLRTRYRTNTQVLPVAAVLGNEEMSHFWVMRLIDDSTAIAVPITKGISTHDSVEVLTPTFSGTDRIILTGAFGLPDTANVIIQSP